MKNLESTVRYAGLIENDVVNGEGVCVTLFMQGCHHHCPHCHNPETWDFNGGIEINKGELLDKILTAISKNGIQRNLSISGGEPLCIENIPFVEELIKIVKTKYPSIKIYCWSGYDFESLWIQPGGNLYYILSNVDVFITGPYKHEQRDITLKLRGSKNQEIWRRNIDGKLSFIKDIDI